MSNFFIMLFGIIHLFAIAGGLWFWILFRFIGTAL